MPTPPENNPVLISRYQPQWSHTARVIATVFLIIAGIYALTLLGPVIQMLTIAFLLAFVMYAPARALHRRGVLSWPAAVVVLYLVLMLLTVSALVLIIPTFVNGTSALIGQGEQAYNNMLAQLREYDAQDGVVFIFNVPVDLNPLIQPLRDFVLGGTAPSTDADGETAPPAETDGETAPPADADGETPTPANGIDLLSGLNLRELVNSIFNVATTLTGTVTSAIGSAAGLLATLLLSVFLSFLILLDLRHSQQQIARWVPPAYHREAALLFEKLQAVWNGFFRGQMLIGLIVGALTWLQLMLMGVPGVAVLAVFTGVVSLIPTLGGFIALVPLALVPLIQGSTVFVEMSHGLFALLVVVVNLLISQVIWNVVAPKILGDALDLPLPVIIVGVFIGAALGGVLGAFLVAPIVSTLRVLVFYTLRKIAQEDPFPGATPRSPLLSDAPSAALPLAEPHG